MAHNMTYYKNLTRTQLFVLKTKIGEQIINCSDPELKKVLTEAKEVISTVLVEVGMRDIRKAKA